MEDLTDVVHWALDAPGHLRGGGHLAPWVQVLGCLASRIRHYLSELGPNDFLVVRTQNDLRALGPGGAMAHGA
jgi:hypothetical protein